ncbi:MAG TPA: energy transducer TonB [Candidatus Acidoferrum sp.]|nr:energy transducer TonB [Candidatus Acidoferrum sp.]
MSRNQRLVQILVLGSALSMGLRLQAQSAPHSINPAIAQLAARIAQPLQESHAKKIIVADLTGPDGQSHPVGKWLADQLSDSLSRDFPGLNIIARPADQAVAKNGHASDTLASADQSAKAWAHHLGAKVVITGSFAKTADGIAISLAASHSSGSQYMVGDATGIVPISDEITALSADPIPELNTGIARAGAERIARAGVGGIGIPTCIQCPPPEYTRKARAAKVQGSVVLYVTITADGQATNISVARSLEPDMDAQAIKAVSKWTFKPAIGPGGKPVPVIVPIEVTFRLY